MSGFWLAAEPLVLASGSAARRLLLENAGIPITVRPAEIDERAIELLLRTAGATPNAVAMHLARAKALAISHLHPGRLVLGADQTLSLGPVLFAKPPTIAAARDHLRHLSGQTHQLHSAVCLVRDSDLIFDHVAEARLTMRNLSDAFLDAYLAIEGARVCASVGAYRLEGPGVQLFTAIEGDHATILGLPLLDLLPALRQHGYLLG